MPLSPWFSGTAAAYLRLAIVVFACAGGAPAQCGANQVTTAPAFVANNGGEVGGVVYFTLDVMAIAGVSICGISVHTTVGGGAAIDGFVYLHQSATDVDQLTAANNTAGDWCAIAGLTGVGNGIGAPSPCSLVNATNSIDLAPGQYLLAVGNGDFDHDYTNGTGCSPGNQCAGNIGLGFRGGKASNDFPSPAVIDLRVFNATFDYDIAAAPVTTTPCGLAAACTSSGVACGGVPSHLHELFPNTVFDLGSTDLLLTSSGFAPVAQTAIVTPAGPGLTFSDDGSSDFAPLGFTLALGGDRYHEFSVCSNGYIRFDGNSSGIDYSESEAEFYAEGARLAPLWDDLNPSVGGAIHIETNAGNVRITYLDIHEWGQANTVTFQVEITPTTVLYRYDASSTFNTANGGALVGYANGTAGAVLAGFDLSAAPTAPVLGAPDLSLSCDSPAIAGGVLVLTMHGNRTIGAVLAALGQLGGGAPLGAPFAPNCTRYIAVGHFNLGVATTASASYPISIPIGAAFLGLPLSFQAAAVDAATAVAVASNGITAIVGDF